MIEQESLWRLGSFLLFLCFFACLELFFPKKNYQNPRSSRWLVNFSLVGIDTLVLRLVFPLLAVETAIWAKQNQWGLFHHFIVESEAVALVLGVLVLDLAIYFQHRLFHKVPVLWRMHRVHHSDIAIDVSTGLRFHPFEIVISMLIKMGLVLALGLSPAVVIVFEILLNVSSLFNHANCNLRKWDAWIQKLVVTPDMHRIHHSIRMVETNSNFGFCLSLWDRLFQTYRPNSLHPIEDMQIGLENYRSPSEQTLFSLLKNPFV